MKKIDTDEKYMKQALKLAEKAYENGDVPIGCVIVYDGKVIGRGYNRRNKDKTTLAHAEILANVCDAGTLSNVRRSHTPGPYSKSGHRMHESKGGMCWLGYKSS